MKEIDDTEEETITDEPVIPPIEPTEAEAVEDTKKEWEKSPSPLYKLYMMTQEKYPERRYPNAGRRFLRGDGRKCKNRCG